MARIAVIGSKASSLTNFRGAMLQAFRSAGHEVLASAPNLDDAVQTTLHEWGVETRSVTMQRQGVNPTADLNTVWDLYRVFREWSPEKVLSYTAKPVVYGSLAASAAGATPYAMITGLGYNYTVDNTRTRLIRTVMDGLYRIAFATCESIIFHNADNASLLSEKRVLSDGADVHVVGGSGVDTEHFYRAPLPDAPVVFLCMGRFIAEKGIREYAAAARRVKKKHPAARFLLAGRFEPGVPDAITESELEKWTDEGIIEHLGLLDDVRPALKEASVYVLPSYYREGVPRSTLEALAMGRPVITTDHPGCRETVQHKKNGLLVPPKTEEKLAKAMCWMIHHPERRTEMAEKSRQLATEQFDVEHVNRRIMEAMDLQEG